MVTAAEVLSVAAFLEDREAQAFPSFGSERMGAPVTAYCRIDDKPIRIREPIAAPDAVVVQDPTLLSNPNLFIGLAGGGFVLINSERPLSELSLPALPVEFPPNHVVTIRATEIARRHSGKPIVNLAMLGGLLAVTGVLRLESLRRAILEKFPGKMGQSNVTAAEEIYLNISGRREILAVDKPQSSYQSC